MNEDAIMDIEDWALVSDHGFGRLLGVVKNHPTLPKHGRKLTSRISAITGDLVRTESGSIYRLGKPNDVYRQFCIDNNIKLLGKTE